MPRSPKERTIARERKAAEHYGFTGAAPSRFPAKSNEKESKAWGSLANDTGDQREVSDFTVLQEFWRIPLLGQEFWRIPLRSTASANSTRVVQIDQCWLSEWHQTVFQAGNAPNETADKARQ